MKSELYRVLKAVVLISFLAGCSNPEPHFGTYITGDFHQHTTFTDGSLSMPYVMHKEDSVGLDWWVSSEHGGSSLVNGLVSGRDVNGGTEVFWDSYSPDPILGNKEMESSSEDHGKSHRVMWRWQSIRDYSFKGVLDARQKYPDKIIIQGLEWNVPGHDNASTGIITNEFSDNPNADAMAEFEYKFDEGDTDTIGPGNWVKSKKSGHGKTIEAIEWLQVNHRYTSWVVPGHPERSSGFTISDFRNMNIAGPDVCFGFESMPGHQKSGERGGYSSTGDVYGKCTYGGTGFMAAKVGGLWDALLSEGRHWWLFANSDFHDITDDFYPGEYEKNYVSVSQRNAQGLVDGMRSGNVYVVQGGLIDTLRFSVDDAVMGMTCNPKGSSVTIKIRVRENGRLDHIDLIAGRLTGIIQPGDPAFDVDSVATTRVIARFDAKGGITDSKGITSVDWNDEGAGYKEMSYRVNDLVNDMYFRLRGTNHGLNVASETDGAGNPLPDTLLEPNNAEKAMADLWFYSNPIWVKSKR
jgi:hypothetical protein